MTRVTAEYSSLATHYRAGRFTDDGNSFTLGPSATSIDAAVHELDSDAGGPGVILRDRAPNEPSFRPTRPGVLALVAIALSGCATLSPALARLDEAREQADRALTELTHLVAWCDDQPAPQPEVCAPARETLDSLAELRPYLEAAGLEAPGGEP